MNETLLQVAGRLHPLLLHLPIGILVALILLEIIGRVRGHELDRGVRLLLIWVLAASAGVSVGSGILLSDEPAYGGGVIDIHRWLGIVTAVALGLGAIFATASYERGYFMTLLGAAILIVPTGHLGASMTHGEGFLTDPLVARAATPLRATLDTLGYTSAAATPGSSWYAEEIAPIFAANCTVCHGEKRRKGGLALHATDAIREADLAELARRVQLPLTDEDHMPPEGKPQLSGSHIATLVQWIETGASFHDKTESSTPRVADATEPERPALSHEAIADLQAAHVHVEVIDPEAGLLWIDFTAIPEMPLSDIQRLLTPLASHTSELSLRGVDHAGDTLARCGPWPHLRWLDLSTASVGRAGLDAAAASGTLSELKLIEATLTPDAADALASMESIETLHVWGANIPTELMTRLRGRPTLTLNDGSIASPAALEIEPAVTLARPVIAAASLTPINTLCPVTGSPVDPRFAVVHDGKVIGFCCKNCPGRFWESPGEFPVTKDVAAGAVD